MSFYFVISVIVWDMYSKGIKKWFYLCFFVGFGSKYLWCNCLKMELKLIKGLEEGSFVVYLGYII